MAEQWIYVLRLEGGKYYVGKSGNVLMRCQEHLNGGGSEWTRRHRVDKLIECVPMKTQFDEDNKVKELMMVYGFSNVRGGIYSRPELTQEEITILTREFQGARDLCFRCGNPGHFTRECPAIHASDFSTRPPPVQSVQQREEPSLLGSIMGAFGVVLRVMADDGFPMKEEYRADAFRERTTGEIFCFRCGRGGHTRYKCYAKTNVKGERIDF